MRSSLAWCKELSLLHRGHGRRSLTVARLMVLAFLLLLHFCRATTATPDVSPSLTDSFQNESTVKTGTSSLLQKQQQAGPTAAPPRSPLQAYLYSSAAAASQSLRLTRVLKEASSDVSLGDTHAPRESAAQQVHQHVKRANFVGESATVNENGLPPHSASADVHTAFAQVLTGRYLILCRSAAPARASHTKEASAVHTSEGHRAVDKTTLGPLQMVRDQTPRREASELPSMSSASLRDGHKTSRVYPEEALRQLLHKVTRHSVTSPTAQQRTGVSNPFSQNVSQPSRRSSPVAPAASTELEVHVVDAAHILVYFPATVASAVLLRAMAKDGDDIESGWRVWDVFARDATGSSSISGGDGGGGPQLKLSETVRRLLQRDASRVEDSSASFIRQSASHTTYDVTLWTARGMASTVRHALMHTPRLQRFLTHEKKEYRQESPLSSSSTASGDARCRLVLEPADENAESLTVHIETDTSEAVARGDKTCVADKCAAASSTPFFDVPVPDTGIESTAFMSNSATQLLEPTNKPGSRTCLRKLVLSLAAHPAVRWVEESYRHPETLNYVAARVLQHGTCSPSTAGGTSTVLGDHPFWELGYNGTGEIIAVADSGADTQSCFFHDPAEPIAYYPNLNPRHRKILSYYAYNDSNGIVDTGDKDGGHGTHVAGSAGGYMVSSETGEATNVGFGRYNGVATGSKLFIRDLAAGAAGGLSLPMNVHDIFDSAYAAGARISSNSWGFSTSVPYYLAIERIVDQAVAARRDLLIVVASGNSVVSGLYVPGRAKNVLTVGAHLNSLQETVQNTVWPQSSHGPAYDGRRKPDLVGPGGGGATSVVSAKSLQAPGCATLGMHGTSMATAAVAGAAAVARQYLREYWEVENPSSALLKAALLHSTTTLPAGPDRSGLGRLDLSYLLSQRQGETHSEEGRQQQQQLLFPPLAHWLRDDETVHDGDVRQHCFALRGLPEGRNSSSGSDTDCAAAASRTVRATLVWNDPATALEGSPRSQVHDLDLMLVTKHGHTFFSGAGGASCDHVNTVEQVRVPLLTAATAVSSSENVRVSEWRSGFRVVVRGTVVRSAAAGQDYALVVSGPGLVALDDCTMLLDAWRGAAVSSSSSTSFSSAAPSASTSASTAAAAEVAPALSAFCPMNCTQHGRCDMRSLLCVCDAAYTSVDCAECNADVVCHGHGICTDPTTGCTCDSRGHFADAFCATCEKDWYGPNCDSACACKHGEPCDTRTGLCVCSKDTSWSGHGKGCFQGPSCEYCCEGFGGPSCNQRSFWCNATGDPVVVDDPNGGYIQINGYGAYPYSVTCRWAIRGQPGQQIELDFVSYDIERYDSLYIYDLVPDPSAAAAEDNRADASTSVPLRQRRVRRVTGAMTSAQASIRSTREQMDLTFVSDWDGIAAGFVLAYRFLSCSDTCHESNRTGEVGHWACGEAFGLPWEQCLCAPPYVGWHCAEDLTDSEVLSQELHRLSLPSTLTNLKAELAWLLPQSVNVTVAEVRLPVFYQPSERGVLHEQQHSEIVSWLSDTAMTVAPLALPLTGVARLPLMVHGFTDLHVPPVSVPALTALLSDASSSGSASLAVSNYRVSAHLRVTVQLLLSEQSRSDYVESLNLTLGVSAAIAKQGSASSVAAATSSSRFGAPPLALDTFSFTPMTLLPLAQCPASAEKALMVNLQIPLYAQPYPTNGSAVTTLPASSVAANASLWTTRAALTVLWKDVAGLVLPNTSVVDAVVSAYAVVLSKVLSDATAPEQVPSPSSATAQLTPVEVSCRSEASASFVAAVQVGQQVTSQTTVLSDASTKLSRMVLLLLLFCAFCVGVVIGALRAYVAPAPRRTLYTAVQSTDEPQEMMEVVEVRK